jgi:hypothetical protein
MGHVQIVESLEFPNAARVLWALQAHFIQHKTKNIIKFSEGNNSQMKNLHDLRKSFEMNIKYKKNYI